MSLPGSIIKKIRDALISGFPTEEKLKELLYLNLNITGTTYPDGEDYENRVFKLLKNLESEDRIIKIIQVAYTQNSGNSKLHILYKKIPEISLLNIIFPLEEQYFQEIKQSYHSCSSIDDFRDWEPETVEDILDNLRDSDQKRGYESRTIQFVNFLISNKNFQDIANKLKQWCSENIEKVDKPTIPRVAQKQDEENYLIILISPSHQGQQHQSFQVEAWVVFDIKPDELNSTSIIKSQPLEITNKQQERFLFEEISGYVLKDFITQAIDKLKRLPTIELFLPYELLSKPIDALIPKSEDEITDDDDDELPIPIGVKYKVHIRSYQRIKKVLKNKGSDEKIILWQQKWSILQASYTESCINCFISAEINDNWQDIYSKLYSNKIIGLKLLHIPSKDILKVIDATGTPIALWLRQDLENSSLQLDFEEILKCSLIRELPDKIKKTRSDGFRNESHIGNHISLLLDNPYILPPIINSSFTLPTEL